MRANGRLTIRSKESPLNAPMRRNEMPSDMPLVVLDFKRGLNHLWTDGSTRKRIDEMLTHAGFVYHTDEEADAIAKKNWCKKALYVLAPREKTPASARDGTVYAIKPANVHLAEILSMHSKDKALNEFIENASGTMHYQTLRDILSRDKK